jgi:hypothetical protein
MLKLYGEEDAGEFELQHDKKVLKNIVKGIQDNYTVSKLTVVTSLGKYPLNLHDKNLEMSIMYDLVDTIQKHLDSM